MILQRGHQAPAEPRAAIDIRGFRFADPDCATQFSKTVALTAAQHPGFLRCLAKLALRVEPAPDYLSTPSLAYEPGGKLEVALRNGVVEGIRMPPSSPSPQPVPNSAPMGADPSGASRTVPPATLDVLRIAGETAIYPDPDTKKAIAALGHPRLHGLFKVCITALGTIGGVTMMKSTGSIHYDRSIERMIYAWRYRPFLIDGEPAPVCTAVTYIYSQR